MRTAEQWHELLGSQAATIDALELYKEACARRGISDESALESLARARRIYRRTLASVEPDVLFTYACRQISSRQK